MHFPIIILLILSGITQSFAAADQCPTSQKMFPTLQPQTIKNYLQLNKNALKNPEDLICCLTRDKNTKVVVAHASIAGQNGSPHSPRVLVYTTNDKGQLQGVMSINGGEAEMTQGASVEFMFNNEFSGQMELYDIDFSSGKPHMGGKNPELCMNCHGTNGTSGPRTIFEISPWPRFSQTGAIGSDCPQENELRRLMSEQTMKAIGSNPRFKCIPKDAPINTSEFDTLTAEMNDRRIFKFVKGTRDYHKFKYVILGVELCAAQKPLSWIPSSHLSEMAGANFLLKSVRESSGEGLARLLSDHFNKKRQENLNKVPSIEKAIGDLRAGKPVSFNPSLGGTACVERETAWNVENSRRFINMYAQLESDSPLYMKYMADTLMRDENASVEMTPYRYLFESRGIDISDWDMQPFPGYGRSPNLAKWIFNNEPRNSELRRLIGENRSKDFFENGGDPAVCEGLKNLTVKAFSAPSPGTPDEAEAGAVVE